MAFNYSEIWNILNRSFLAAFKWSLWKWLFGSIGAFVGTFLIGKNFFEFTIEDSIKTSVVIIIFLFTLRFVLIFTKESLKYFHEVYKNSIYGDAIILLNECFAAMHNYRKIPEHNDEEFVKSMVLLCNNLKKIFSKLVKSECSVSIKVPIADESIKPITLLSNLVRDVDHNSRDTKDYLETQHTLLGNTAFSYCLNKVSVKSQTKYYKNNNVNKTENYENTSKLLYKDGILPYNSELVFPITPIIDGKNICLGFLCVDTVKENAFQSKYEIAILEGVADGIFDIINIRNQFKASEENGFKNEN